MKSHWIARALGALALVILPAIAVPAMAANYYLEIPASGELTPEPSQPLAGIPPAWIVVTSFSFGVAKPPPHGGPTTAAESLTVTGVNSAMAPALFKDVQTNATLKSLRLIITQPNGSGQQVPSEIINMQNAYVTAASMSGNSAGLTDTFSFNYQAVSYEVASPQPVIGMVGKYTLIWKPQPTRPTMGSLHPIVYPLPK